MQCVEALFTATVLLRIFTLWLPVVPGTVLLRQSHLIAIKSQDRTHAIKDLPDGESEGEWSEGKVAFNPRDSLFYGHEDLMRGTPANTASRPTRPGRVSSSTR